MNIDEKVKEISRYIKDSVESERDFSRLIDEGGADIIRDQNKIADQDQADLLKIGGGIEQNFFKIDWALLRRSEKAVSPNLAPRVYEILKALYADSIIVLGGVDEIEPVVASDYLDGSSKPSTADNSSQNPSARPVGEAAPAIQSVKKGAEVNVPAEVPTLHPSPVANSPLSRGQTGSAAIVMDDVDMRRRFRSPMQVAAYWVGAIRGHTGDDAAKLVHFLTIAIRPLRWMEGNKDYTGEQVVDSVIVVLKELNEHNRFTADVIYILVPALRAKLSEDKNHGSGWHDTLSSLGVFMSMIAKIRDQDKVKSWLMSFIYYNQVVRGLLSGEPVGRQAMETTTHNMAAILMDLLQHRKIKSGPSFDFISSLSAKLSTISVAFSFEVTEDVPLKREMQNVISTFDQEDVNIPHGKAFLEFFSQQKKISTSEGDSIRVAISHCIAAVCRVVLVAEDEVAASFFNAGVTLFRMSSALGALDVYDNGNPAAIGPLKARAICSLMYSLGMYWALFLNTEDLGEALTGGDGLDCAVNLIGTALQGGDDDNFLRQHSQLILKHVLYLVDVLDIENQSTSRLRLAAMRMPATKQSRSLADSAGSGSLAGVFEVADELRAAVIAAVNEAVELIWTPNEASSDQPPHLANHSVDHENIDQAALETAKLVRWICKQLDPDGADLHKIIKNAVDNFHALENSKEDPAGLCKRNYEDTGYMENIFGIIVVYGLASQEELVEAFQVAEGGKMPSVVLEEALGDLSLHG